MWHEGSIGQQIHGLRAHSCPIRKEGWQNSSSNWTNCWLYYTQCDEELARISKSHTPVQTCQWSGEVEVVGAVGSGWFQFRWLLAAVGERFATKATNLPHSGQTTRADTGFVSQWAECFTNPSTVMSRAPDERLSPASQKNVSHSEVDVSILKLKILFLYFVFIITYIWQWHNETIRATRIMIMNRLLN